MLELVPSYNSHVFIQCWSLYPGTISKLQNTSMFSVSAGTCTQPQTWLCQKLWSQYPASRYESVSKAQAWLCQECWSQLLASSYESVSKAQARLCQEALEPVSSIQVIRCIQSTGKAPPRMLEPVSSIQVWKCIQFTDMTLVRNTGAESRSRYNLQTYPEPYYGKNAGAMKYQFLY
jgi:hypothetical protein